MYIFIHRLYLFFGKNFEEFLIFETLPVFGFLFSLLLLASLIVSSLCNFGHHFNPFVRKIVENFRIRILLMTFLSLAT